MDAEPFRYHNNDDNRHALQNNGDPADDVALEMIHLVNFYFFKWVLPILLYNASLTSKETSLCYHPHITSFTFIFVTKISIHKYALQADSACSPHLLAAVIGVASVLVLSPNGLEADGEKMTGCCMCNLMAQQHLTVLWMLFNVAAHQLACVASAPCSCCMLFTLRDKTDYVEHQLLIFC